MVYTDIQCSWMVRATWWPPPPSTPSDPLPRTISRFLPNPLGFELVCFEFFLIFKFFKYFLFQISIAPSLIEPALTSLLALTSPPQIFFWLDWDFSKTNVMTMMIMVMMMMTEMMKHHLLGLLVMSATTVCPLGGVSEMRNGAGRNFAPRVHWFRIGRPVFFNIQRYMYLIVTFLFLFAYGFSVAVWFFWFCGGRESCEQAWFSDGQASCLLMKDIRKFYFLSNCWFSLLIYIYIFSLSVLIYFFPQIFFFCFIRQYCRLWKLHEERKVRV